MKNFLLLFFLTLCTQLFAQNKMEINDPQWWWSTDQASVDNIIISVEPNGMFAEVRMEFDVFSSDEYYFDPDAQLEFVFDFVMDDEIVFNDSWLWINDYISKGEIYELNEGTQIYEDIVDRRQDPSILTKISSNSYNLKIYPLLPDSTRRVMLSYLSPLDFNQGEASIFLPIDIFKPSAETPQNTSVVVIDNEQWLHYEPGNPYTQVSIQGNSTEYRIEDFQSVVDSKISFMSTDYANDYYFGVYSDSTDNYFQMVYFPDLETSQSSTYHFIVLDYDERYVQDNYSKEYILSTLEEQLTSKLGPNDYFNICYSNFVTDFVRDTWTPATRENIENVFSELRTQGYSDISKLEVLLPEALNFINNNQEKSELTILSSGTNFTRQEAAEEFLDYLSDFIEDMTIEVDISVVDFANGYRPSDWINNQLFRGNEYFYNLLTSANSGLHYSTLYGDIPGEALSQILVSQADLITEFDLDLDPANGFTYSNYMNTFNLN
ncbi:MAG: VIT and VWA domain-containing protein, partial [Bacteroidia bacterium]|nr:VIT and VWA domain-containing protein [Bacteroidia bacterium]